jgi:beta-glucosidase
MTVLAAPASGAGRCGDPAQRPWCDTSKTPEERAQLLLAQMTLDEKFSLLAGDDAAGVFTGTPATGTSDGIGRLGVPVMYHSDGPFGPREGSATAMPGPLAVASSFDPRVAREEGAAIADEVKHKGNDLLHAPTVDIMRTPLAGRAFETYGEDPLLASRMAVPFIEGVQKQGIIGNVKHYAPNSQEGEQGVPPLTGGNGSRFLVDAVVDERTLREIYFPAFEAAVKTAGVGAVMCAYGSLNGDYACESRHLLQDVLRREWGFGGLVVSDYGFALKSTEKALNAGTDIEMPGAVLYQPGLIQAAMATGEVSEQTIDARVGATLRTMFRFGLFDRPAFAPDDTAIDKAAHAALAQRTEEQGIVLLRNRSKVLPLRSGAFESLAVIGSVATRYKGGGGSSNVKPFAFKAPLDAIKTRAGDGVTVRYDPGSDAAAAAESARDADAAIVFVEDFATEGSDKPCLRLQCAPVDPVGQSGGSATKPDYDAVIEAVAAANPNTIVVMETGGPVLTPWYDKVKAIVEAWYPGQDGGPAIAAVLFGDVDPGGRLPVSFPAADGDWPTAGNAAQYPGENNQARYSEGVFVGYRHYDQKKIAPRWPFGHGLSYTRFKLDRLKVRGRTVTARVRNTGRRTGSTVVQLYLGMPSTQAAPQPPRSLKGFRKVTLRRKRAKTVRFKLSDRALSYWDTAASGWRIAPGRYRVDVGFSSRKLRRAGAITHA